MRWHIGICGVGVLALVGSALATAPEGAWRVFRGDAEMSGLSAGALKVPLKKVWTFQAGDPVMGTAVIADGLVYIGDGEGMMYCLKAADGKKVWEYESEGPIEGSACVAEGMLVFGSGDGLVYALDAKSGEFRWKYETDGEVLGGVNSFVDKKSGETRVVVGSYDYLVYCFEVKSGEKRWSFETTNYVNGAPTVAEGKVFFGGCDGFVYMVGASGGEEAGKVEIESYISNSVAVRDSVAYVGHYGNAVTAVDLKAGKVKWNYAEQNYPFFAAPAVGEDFVIAASRDKRVYRLDRESGDKVWAFKTGGEVDSSPVVVGEVVLFGSSDGTF
ncbi:MAG: PQQ-binding-like beta-propeller repeat protein, partial [Verrucomicrobiales bacterium]|nr:PQQ-binding-like beta-propeller repeat protein [Verrucomicrobiales bacterium]